jgi:hypothetical protein
MECETDKDPWVVSCAWCGATRERGKWSDGRRSNPADPRTHGICPPCFSAAAPGMPYPLPEAE